MVQTPEGAQETLTEQSVGVLSFLTAYISLPNLLPLFLEICYHFFTLAGENHEIMKTFAIAFLCSPSKMRKDGLSPVQCSISVNGTRMMYTLPIKCAPADFPKMKNKGDLKTLIDNTNAKIGKYRTLCEVQGINCTAAGVKAYLEGRQEQYCTIEQLCDIFLKTKQSNIGIWRKYRNTKKRLIEFLGAEREMETITRQDILDYYNKHSDFSGETLKGEMKRVKAFFNFAFNSGKIKSNPFAGLVFQYKTTDPPFLTYEEIGRLRNCELPDTLSKIRDTFLFMCFSGLEYADLSNLTKDDVKKNKYGQYYIKKKRIKTDIEYISVLYEDAAAIWEKYDGSLYVISNQKFNEHLKVIALAAKIDKNITSLCARHTFATYLLSERMMPIDIVQRILGHTSPRQSLHYAKMLDETVFSVAAASTRLGKAGKKIK